MNLRHLFLSAPLALLAAALALASATPPPHPSTPASAPADFSIRIQRPFKPAQSFFFTNADTFRSSDKVDLPGGISTRTQSFRRTNLDADVRIDKVDDQGYPTAQTVTIKRLSQQLNNTGQEQSPARTLLDPGAEITITFSAGKLAFSRKNGPLLPDESLSALQSAFQPLALSDDLYGAKDRKKPGDSWPINKSALPADRTNPNFIDPALVSGTVTFNTLRTLAGVACLQLHGSMLTQDAPLGASAPKQATVALTFTLNLPIDLNLPPMACSLKRATHIITENQPLGRGTVTHTIDSEITHESTWTPK